MPANVSCAFAQNQVTLSGNDQVVTVALKIATTQQAENRAPQSPLNPTLFALAFWWPGGLTGLAIFMRKRILHKKQKLLAALPIPGLRVGLRRRSIGLRFEQRHGRQRGTSTPRRPRRRPLLPR